MHVTLRRDQDGEELRGLIARERRALPRDRYRAVLLAMEGREAEEIAAALGRARRSVQRWVYAYRDGGIAALEFKKRGGKKPRLSPPDSQRLVQRIAAGPTPADGVCALRGRDAQRILQEEFGQRYSLGGAYDLLHRLGFSCLRPRPRHRKSDPATQEGFQADAPLLSGG